VFAHRDFLYYFKRLVPYPNGKVRAFEKKDDLAMEKLLSLSDVVVLEINEAFVHKTGYGFLERALEVLEEHEPLGGAQVTPTAASSPSDQQAIGAIVTTRP
jgi:hypothetical protein